MWNKLYDNTLKEKKMKLNIPERLTMVNVLPEKGSFATLKTIEELKSRLYPSEKEVKKFEIKQNGNNISWNPKGIEQIEIEVSEVQKNIVVEALEELDKKELATSQHFHLYQRLTEQNKE